MAICAATTTQTETEMESKKTSILALLEGNHLQSIRHVVDKATNEFKDYHRLNLPPEISALIARAPESGDVELDEAAIGKARKILNSMMESAQNELDIKTMACKEFKEKNRGTWEQVSTDLKRLSTQIANLEGIKQDASAEIAKATEFVNKIEEDLHKEQIVYEDIRRVDEEEMVWRKNDLRVAEFLLKLTKCKDTFMFLQKSTAERSELSLKRCTRKFLGKQHHSVSFAMKKLRLAMMSTSKHAKQKIHRALLSASDHDFAKDDDDAYEATEEPAGPGSAANAETLAKMKKIAEGNSKPASTRKQAKKCTLGRPNCGLLHDNMSLMWGEMKDAVDELDTKMRREEKDWRKKLDNWNEQISLATGNKETSQGHLSAAIAEQTADQAEQEKKEQEERRLEDEFRKGWAACEAEMNEILFTKFCGVKSARGELHKKGAVKPEDLMDCEVTDWVAQACSVPCDDELVGGIQEMIREVVQMPNENGVNCPALMLKKKCNQVPCPVDCKMTRWSRWSSCTTECGGGVKGRTRSVDVRPRNGGQFCDVPSELTACNTGSCDRNCNLTRWKIRPCSVSCGGGFMVRKRHVRRRARGKGKCPKKRSFKRYGKRRCNRHRCYGDEECLAKQDVIVAIDGSGSVKSKGFRILKNFAAALVTKYRGEVEEMVENDETGEEELKNVIATQVGVIQFGNGKLLENNVVGPADVVKPLDNNIAASKDAIKGLSWRKGFTNMAQAFTGAESVFLNGGRKHAQSVIILISDGKPSFNFQTQNAVRKARRKGVKVVMVVVKEFMKPEQKKLMRKWASVPRRTNFIHIPGLKELRKRNDDFVNKVLIRSCSKTISLKKEAEEQQRWEQAKAMEDLAEYTETPAPA